MIRSLRIFCDVVDTQSFTEAARRNYLTQSAVSQHLKAMEEQFGHRLLERGRGVVSLTPAGRLVDAAAREILWRYQRLQRMLERPPTEVTGPLRIAACLSVGLYELPPYLTTFLKRYPKVDLKLSFLPIPDVYDAVLANHADVGLVAFPEPHPGLIIQLFKKDQFVVIAPPTHSLAARKRLHLKRLSDQPLIVMEAGSPMRKATDRILSRAGVRMQVAHEFDNVELIKRAVEVGSGIALVPKKAVSGEIQAHTLSQLKIAEGPFDHPIGILTRRQAGRPLAAQRLITALLSPRSDKAH